MLTEDRRCGQCGEPVTEWVGEPYMEMANPAGFVETLAVAYLLKPCGHVFVKAVG